MQDPFFAVKEEVEHSVTVVTQLHGKWKELLKSKAKGDLSLIHISEPTRPY